MTDGHFILTVTNYSTEEEVEGEEEVENPNYVKTRITIAPHMVQFVIASENSVCMVDGRELKKVNVILTEGNNLELLISEVDLLCIEQAIGSYFLNPG